MSFKFCSILFHTLVILLYGNINTVYGLFSHDQIFVEQNYTNSMNRNLEMSKGEAKVYFFPSEWHKTDIKMPQWDSSYASFNTSSPVKNFLNMSAPVKNLTRARKAPENTKPSSLGLHDWSSGRLAEPNTFSGNSRDERTVIPLKKLSSEEHSLVVKTWTTSASMQSDLEQRNNAKMLQVTRQLSAFDGCSPQCNEEISPPRFVAPRQERLEAKRLLGRYNIQLLISANWDSEQYETPCLPCDRRCSSSGRCSCTRCHAFHDLNSSWCEGDAGVGISASQDIKSVLRYQKESDAALHNHNIPGINMKVSISGNVPSFTFNFENNFATSAYGFPSQSSQGCSTNLCDDVAKTKMEGMSCEFRSMTSCAQNNIFSTKQDAPRCSNQQENSADTGVNNETQALSNSCLTSQQQKENNGNLVTCSPSKEQIPCTLPAVGPLSNGSNICPTGDGNCGFDSTYIFNIPNTIHSIDVPEQTNAINVDKNTIDINTSTLGSLTHFRQVEGPLTHTSELLNTNFTVTRLPNRESEYEKSISTSTSLTTTLEQEDVSTQPFTQKVFTDAVSNVSQPLTPSQQSTSATISSSVSSKETIISKQTQTQTMENSSKVQTVEYEAENQTNEVSDKLGTTETSTEIQVESTIEAQEVEASTEPQEVEPSTEPHEVENSTEPQEVETLIEPQEVKISTEPQEVEISTELREPETSTEAQEVETSTETQEMETSIETQEVENSTEPQEVETSTETQEIETSTETQEMEISTNTQKVETSTETQEMETLTEPQEVETSTEPQEVENSSEPQEVETLIEPQEVKISTEPQEVEISTELREPETSTETQEVETSTETQGMETSIETQEVETITETQEMEISTNTQEVKISTEPQEVEISTELREPETSTETQEVETSTETQGMETSIETQEVENSTEPQEVETSTETQEIETLTEPQKVETSTETQEMEISTNTQEVETSTETQEMETLTEPQEVETSTEPQEVETSTEPQEVKTLTEPQEVETSAETQEVEASTEPQEVETLTEPQEVETSTETQEMEISTNTQKVETSTETQEMETLTEPQEVETSTEPQEVRTLTEPQEVETSTETQEMETSIETQEVENSTEPQEVETSTEPQEVKTLTELREVETSTESQEIETSTVSQAIETSTEHETVKFSHRIPEVEYFTDLETVEASTKAETLTTSSGSPTMDTLSETQRAEYSTDAEIIPLTFRVLRVEETPVMHLNSAKTGTKYNTDFNINVTKGPPQFFDECSTFPTLENSNNTRSTKDVTVECKSTVDTDKLSSMSAPGTTKQVLSTHDMRPYSVTSDRDERISVPYKCLTQVNGTSVNSDIPGLIGFCSSYNCSIAWSTSPSLEGIRECNTSSPLTNTFFEETIVKPITSITKQAQGVDYCNSISQRSYPAYEHCLSSISSNPELLSEFTLTEKAVDLNLSVEAPLVFSSNCMTEGIKNASKCSPPQIQGIPENGLSSPIETEGVSENEVVVSEVVNHNPWKNIATETSGEKSTIHILESSSTGVTLGRETPSFVSFETFTDPSDLNESTLAFLEASEDNYVVDSGVAETITFSTVLEDNSSQSSDFNMLCLMPDCTGPKDSSEDHSKISFSGTVKDGRKLHITKPTSSVLTSETQASGSQNATDIATGSVDASSTSVLDVGTSSATSLCVSTLTDDIASCIPEQSFEISTSINQSAISESELCHICSSGGCSTENSSNTSPHCFYSSLDQNNSKIQNCLTNSSSTHSQFTFSVRCGSGVLTYLMVCEPTTDPYKTYSARLHEVAPRQSNELEQCVDCSSSVLRFNNCSLQILWKQWSTGSAEGLSFNKTPSGESSMMEYIETSRKKLVSSDCIKLGPGSVHYNMHETIALCLNRNVEITKACLSNNLVSAAVFSVKPEPTIQEPVLGSNDRSDKEAGGHMDYTTQMCYTNKTNHSTTMSKRQSEDCGSHNESNLIKNISSSRCGIDSEIIGKTCLSNEISGAEAEQNLENNSSVLTVPGNSNCSNEAEDVLIVTRMNSQEELEPCETTQCSSQILVNSSTITLNVSRKASSPVDLYRAERVNTYSECKNDSVPRLVPEHSSDLLATKNIPLRVLKTDHCVSKTASEDNCVRQPIRKLNSSPVVKINHTNMNQQVNTTTHGESSKFGSTKSIKYLAYDGEQCDFDDMEVVEDGLALSRFNKDELQASQLALDLNGIGDEDEIVFAPCFTMTQRRKSGVRGNATKEVLYVLPINNDSGLSKALDALDNLFHKRSPPDTWNISSGETNRINQIRESIFNKLLKSLNELNTNASSLHVAPRGFKHNTVREGSMPPTIFNKEDPQVTGDLPHESPIRPTVKKSDVTNEKESQENPTYNVTQTCFGSYDASRNSSEEALCHPEQYSSKSSAEKAIISSDLDTLTKGALEKIDSDASSKDVTQPNRLHEKPMQIVLSGLAFISAVLIFLFFVNFFFKGSHSLDPSALTGPYIPLNEADDNLLDQGARDVYVPVENNSFT